MRAYETTFILVPSLDAKGVAHEVDAVKEIITSHGGTVTAEKEWGRRRLAYPLRDLQDGIYYILRFEVGNEGLADLARRFKLNENVLRHLVIRDEGTPIEYVSHPGESDERDDYHRDRRPSSWDSGGRGRSDSETQAVSAEAEDTRE